MPDDFIKTIRDAEDRSAERIADAKKAADYEIRAAYA